MTAVLRDLLDTREVRKLAGIKQNGPAFRNIAHYFKANVTVTSPDGESQNATSRITVGKEPAVLACDLPGLVQKSNVPRVTFLLDNASGTPLDGKGEYIIYKGKEKVASATFEANKAVEIPALRQLPSGKYLIEAEVPEVTEEDIALVASKWTGIPVTRLTQSETDKILHMEEHLHERIIGQDDAVKAVSLAIRRKYPHVQVPAMDFCPPMLQRGLHKLKGDNARAIMPVAADAKKLPLPDASVDCVTMAFGIRNIKPRSEAFAEMLRVLTPGGRACILEFGSGSERIWGGLYNFYLDRILPRIGKMVSRDPGAYEYLAETIRNFPTAPALEKEMTDAGFARAWHIKLTSGIVCLHVGEKAR